MAKTKKIERKYLTITEKGKILDELDKGIGGITVAKNRNIAPNTVSRIRQRRSEKKLRRVIKEPAIENISERANSLIRKRNCIIGFWIERQKMFR